jgi:hypothetical protein
MNTVVGIVLLLFLLLTVVSYAYASIKEGWLKGWASAHIDLVRRIGPEYQDYGWRGAANAVFIGVFSIIMELVVFSLIWSAGWFALALILWYCWGIDLDIRWSMPFKWLWTPGRHP